MANNKNLPVFERTEDDNEVVLTKTGVFDKEKYKETLANTLKWQKENTKTFTFRFNTIYEKPYIDWIASHSDKKDYYCDLIRKDIDKEKKKTTKKK